MVLPWGQSDSFAGLTLSTCSAHLQSFNAPIPRSCHDGANPGQAKAASVRVARQPGTWSTQRLHTTRSTPSGVTQTARAWKPAVNL
ncbi:hypothetical protein C8Q73DRAFT_275249 [Cubamyces lactineus]|nr:hypothetical protein C8Q73DRAFT_275249 [Cubamyces lactineus]